MMISSAACVTATPVNVSFESTEFRSGSILDMVTRVKIIQRAELVTPKHGMGKLSVARKGTKLGPKGNPLGRPKGTPNKTTRILKEAILQAAYEYGEDGRGKNGIVGLCTRLIKRDLVAFSRLMARVIPMQVDMRTTDERTQRLYKKAEEFKQELRQLGIEVDHIFETPDMRTINVSATEVQSEAPASDDATTQPMGFYKEAAE